MTSFRDDSDSTTSRASLQSPELAGVPALWAQRIFWLSLMLGVGAFVLIWGQLAAASRISMDDFCYVSQMHEYGLWDSLVRSRDGWWSRWASQIIINVSGNAFLHNGSAVAYNASAFAALWASLWVLVKRVSQRAQWGFSWWQCAALSLASLAMLYALAPVRSEVWFWVSGSAVYLLALVLAIVIAALLVAPRVRMSQSVLAALCAWALTGMSEATWLMVLLLWGAALWWSARHERAQLLARAWPFAVLLIGAAIALSAPGNWNRSSIDGNADTNAQTLISLFFYTYLVLLAFNSWVWVVAIATGAALKSLLPTRPPRKRVWWVPLIFLGLSFLAQAPAILGFRAAAPPRTWLPTEVFLLLCLGTLGWLLAPQGKIPRNAMLLTGALAWLLFLPFFWRQQNVGVPAARVAVAAYDRDYALLLRERNAGRRAPLRLQPLPAASEVFLWGPLPNNQYGVNDCMRDSLKLPFDIGLEEQK